MHDHRETDERLRTRLNSDQVARERMCIAILALDPRYSKVEPRRPEGGPDQGRDLQAIWDGKILVWGAVGFQNMVSDTPAEKSAAFKKFKADLNSALEEKPDLKGFVFFTNVDLTPGEGDELRTHAESLGITHVEIFWRERLRIALDSPSGLGLRYLYLKMTLSDAEQASFFSSWGAQLEGLITQHRKATQDGFDRLEMLHFLSRPLRLIEFTLHFDQDISMQMIGRFRVMCKIFHTPEDRLRAWWLGGCDMQQKNSLGYKNFGQSHRDTVCSVDDDKPQLTTLKPAVRMTGGACFSATFSVGFGPPTSLTPEFREHRLCRFFFTQNIAPFVKRVSFHVNGYAVVHQKVGNLEKRKLDINWPVEAGPSEEFEWLESGEFFAPSIHYSYNLPKSTDIPYITRKSR